MERLMLMLVFLLIAVLLIIIFETARHLLKIKRLTDRVVKAHDEAAEYHRHAQEGYAKSQTRYEEVRLFSEHTKVVGVSSVKLHTGFLRYGEEFFTSEKGVLYIREALKALNELRIMHPDGDWEPDIATFSRLLQ